MIEESKIRWFPIIIYISVTPTAYVGRSEKEVTTDTSTTDDRAYFDVSALSSVMTRLKLSFLDLLNMKSATICIKSVRRGYFNH